MTEPQVRATIVALTDLGQTRDHNEDTFLIADLTRRTIAAASGVTRQDVGPRGCLFLVADGMGGAAAGEIASAMAADAIYRHLLDAWTTAAEPTPEQFARELRVAVERANTELHDYAQGHPEVRGMGTTATVGALFQNALYLAQVGDSRAYLVRGSEATQLTKDQSLTQRLVDAGEMTEEEAEQSTRRNIILQALGPDPRVKVDLTFLPLLQGDVIMLCSDGLSGQLKREEIAAHAAGGADLSAAAAALVALANSRGGPDNITVVLVQVEGDGLPAADPALAAEYQATAILDDDSGDFPATTTEIRSTQPIPVARRPDPTEVAEPVPPREAAPAARRSSTTPARFGTIGLGVLGALALLYWILSRLAR